MTTMDKITEEIAHFIGLFHTTVEEARQRDAYPDFTYYMQKDHLYTDPFITSSFDAPYEFLGFDPDVLYKAPAYVRPLEHPSFVSWQHHPPIPVVRDDSEYFPPEQPQDVLPGARLGQTFAMPPIEPPGSVVNYILQAASLSDDDSFNVGGSHVVFNPDPIDDTALLKAADDVLSSAPIGHPEMPGSTAELIDVINNVADQLKSLVVVSGGPMETFVEQSTVIEGVYVNGELVEDAPKLEDYFSFEDEEDAENPTGEDSDEDNAAGGEADEDDGPLPNVVISEDGTITIDNSVELVAGDNTVINQAVVKNLWTGATVTAVVGDHVEVNAIVQTNAIWDTDSITSAIGGWTSEDSPNELFNVATFERTDPLEENADDQAVEDGFPSAWVVTEIQGDLLITNWLEQYVFMTDNDIGVLSSSGATTSVIAGDNTSVNQISIFELGFSFDLIIVGGSLYDANIIHQTNVLFDNDVVGAVEGFETTGQGSIGSSGNLLWNQAHIYNIGGADRFGELPSAYLDAANDMAAGGSDLSKGVLTDPAFAGLSGLRVLYISGDFLNIQYIKQTNIVGDSDQIALAMNALDPQADATWTVSTGANALINNAAILDFDSFGHTYVGGQQYSEETLFQAELISHQPELLTGDPDTLVNEAVVFLDDSMLDGEFEEPGVTPAEHDDGHYQNDGLQHVLG
jgi:hypothetical protein